MTRTLQNALMALSTTGLVLVIGLMVAAPLAPSTLSSPAAAWTPEVGAGIAPGQALVLTAARVAGPSTEAAVAALADARPKRRSARNAIALPYFSFARGLRRGNGG
ncbi:MAG TPA: hypothetical protein VLK29_09865 [Luteimonas sp.]|nr:hypothetical protein [Luteimonas sp.]